MVRQRGTPRFIQGDLRDLYKQVFSSEAQSREHTNKPVQKDQVCVCVSRERERSWDSCLNVFPWQEVKHCKSFTTRSERGSVCRDAPSACLFEQVALSHWNSCCVCTLVPCVQNS